MLTRADRCTTGRGQRPHRICERKLFAAGAAPADLDALELITELPPNGIEVGKDKTDQHQQRNEAGMANAPKDRPGLFAPRDGSTENGD